MPDAGYRAEQWKSCRAGHGWKARTLPLVVVAVGALWFAACSDEEDGTECVDPTNCPPITSAAGEEWSWMSETRGASEGAGGTDARTSPAQGESNEGTHTSASGGPDGTSGAADEWEGRFCQEICESDGDCLDGFSCLQERCVSSQGGSCASDQECVALFSGWNEPCASDAECGSGDPETNIQACVDFEGSGVCAMLEVTPFDENYCSTVNMDVLQLQRADGSGPIAVCGQPDARCHPNAYCELPCGSDTDCASPEYPICDTESGRCVCTQNSCANDFQCSTDGYCRCTTDAQCAGLGSTTDRCFVEPGSDDGFCGCSSSEVCVGERAHPGTSTSCEGFDL